MALSIPIGKLLALYKVQLKPELVGVLTDQFNYEARIIEAISIDRGGYELDPNYFIMNETISNCGDLKYEVIVRGDCNHHYIYGYYLLLVNAL